MVSPGAGMPPHHAMLMQQQQGQRHPPPGSAGPGGAPGKDGMSELQKLVNMQNPDMPGNLTPEAMRSQAQVAATIAAVQVSNGVLGVIHMLCHASLTNFQDPTPPLL